MKILLLRHGAVKGNLEKRYVGRTDEELDRGAALQLREFSKKNDPDFYGRLGELSAIYMSPMKRCQETAGLLFPDERFPLTVRKKIDGLRECDFGDFEYKNYQELAGDSRYQAFIDSGGTKPFPGGESIESFKARSVQAFLNCLQDFQKSSGETAAFVVHGGTIMALMEAFAVPHGEYFSWQVKNGCGFFAKADFAADRLCLSQVAKISVL